MFQYPAASSSVATSQESKQKKIKSEDIDEFITKMTSGVKSYLVAEHEAMRLRQRHIYAFNANTMKNRYKNIVLFDEGAVTLEPTKPDKPDDTYIHATKIKSKFGNYVLAQSPKDDTLNDWYRMIWQLKIGVIVCLIPLTDPKDCSKYFEKQVGKKIKHKRFVVRTLASRKDGSFKIYDLKLINKDVKDEERTVQLVNLTEWKVISRPPEPRKFLDFMRAVWATEASAKLADEDKVPPTLVHGITGTRRTGTYVIMSMLCKQMQTSRQMSLLKACSRVRQFRYSVVRNRICFSLLVESTITFAADQGLVDRATLNFRDALKVVELSTLRDSFSVCVFFLHRFT
ncbi:unnamed protein product [Anisakis simplex]|uniref:Tyrosine-protein phosphatase domain-containing protein n=1 Tax=Anisakis simplex TaxID=6269 RepID=A0A158PPF4_ANISI|nr:unnamed protein product [Anisakis simplex]